MLSLAAALASLGSGCSEPKAVANPDIVIYLCDTLRADHLGAYGYKRDTSPNIDLLAEDAIVFENALAPSSWTKASTASLMTGLYPVQHRANGRDTRVSDKIQLLSETLKARGYYSAGIVTNPFVSETFGFDQGYDVFEFIGRAVAETLMDKVEQILANREKEKPLFLYVHSIDPHAPYDAPAPFGTVYSEKQHLRVPDALNAKSKPNDIRSVVDSYDSEILYHDEQFKRLVDSLKAEGLYDECMFWFVSDHGDEFIEHGRGGHGRQLFNESLHIPMILKLPNNQFAGTRVSALSSLIDVVPTVSGYLGEFPPEQSEGLDLMVNLTGRGDRPPLYLHLDLMVEQLFVASGVINGNYKYMVESLPLQREFLFDLDADPKEKSNLIKSHPEVAAELATLVKIHEQARRSGLTLKIVGKGTQRVRARLRTEGKVTDLEPFELEEGDEASVDESGQVVTLELTLKEFLSNIGKLPTSDIDTVTLRTDPPDAGFTVELLELVDSEIECPLYLGLDRIPGKVPQFLSPTDPVLLTSDLGLLFRKDRNRAGSNTRGDAKKVKQPKPGMYVLALEEIKHEAIESLPEDLRKQLEELGYLGAETEEEPK